MVKVGIIGASGYAGAELVRLLMNHPKTKLAYITSTTYEGQKISDLYPNLKGLCDLSFLKYEGEEGRKQGKRGKPGNWVKEAEVIFVALPHGRSLEIIPNLLEEGVKVIDLSGDFRLSTKEAYERWYNYSHTAPAWLGKAVYGLPELNRKEIEEATFVSNPGCYPASALLATAPLLKENLIFEEDIIIDSLSGVSGAGREPKGNTHYCTRDENISSYKVGGVHQHIPEMEQEMSKISGTEVKISFTPHLAPLSRGIYSTIYADLKKDLSTSELIKIFKDFYEDAYFVQVLGEGEYPEVKAVVGTNFCHLGLKVDQRTRRVIIMSALDNLGKGASGQAIQNMNLMYSFAEEEGLKGAGLFP